MAGKRDIKNGGSGPRGLIAVLVAIALCAGVYFFLVRPDRDRTEKIMQERETERLEQVAEDPGADADADAAPVGESQEDASETPAASTESSPSTEQPSITQGTTPPPQVRPDPFDYANAEAYADDAEWWYREQGYEDPWMEAFNYYETQGPLENQDGDW